MDSDERPLIPGLDISRWPEMRVARAREGLNALSARIGTWTAAGGAAVIPVPSQAGDSIELRLKVETAPPLPLWSMDLGESVHHIRAALDALAWDFAHLDGREPDDEKTVYFPVLDLPSKWVKFKKRELFPTRRMDLIEQLQPYQDHGQGHSFLGSVHSLDIADKHRGLLDGRARLTGIDLEGISFGAGQLTKAELDQMRIELTEEAIELEDGKLVGRIHLPRPIDPMTVREVPVRIEVTFSIAHDTALISLEQIQSLPALAHQVIRGICAGPSDGT